MPRMDKETLYQDLYELLYERIGGAIEALDTGRPRLARELLALALQKAEQRRMERSRTQ